MTSLSGMKRLLQLLLLILPLNGLSAQEEISYPDLVFLANGQSMQVMLDKLPGEGAQEVQIKTPGGGDLSLDLALIAEIRPGLDYRLQHADRQNHEELVELSRYCLAAQRKKDALSLLKRAHKQQALKPAQLRVLAQLTDEFDGPKQALPLYEQYRKQGGREASALQRLQVLEKAIADHQAKIEQIFAENPAAKVISEGLEKNTNWRSENQKWANPVTVSNNPVKMGENRVNMVLQADYKSGEKHKAAVVLQTKLDVREQSLLTFYVSNPSQQPIRLSVAIKCGDRWDYYESRTKSVAKQAVWQQLSFDLKRKDFKSQASDWQHRDAISQPHAVREIQILMHNGKRDGSLMIDGIGFSKSDKEF